MRGGVNRMSGMGGPGRSVQDGHVTARRGVLKRRFDVSTHLSGRFTTLCSLLLDPSDKHPSPLRALRPPHQVRVLVGVHTNCVSQGLPFKERGEFNPVACTPGGELGHTTPHACRCCHVHTPDVPESTSLAAQMADLASVLSAADTSARKAAAARFAAGVAAGGPAAAAAVVDPIKAAAKDKKKADVREAAMISIEALAFQIAKVRHARTTCAPRRATRRLTPPSSSSLAAVAEEGDRAVRHRPAGESHARAGVWGGTRPRHSPSAPGGAPGQREGAPPLRRAPNVHPPRPPHHAPPRRPPPSRTQRTPRTSRTRPRTPRRPSSPTSTPRA